MNQEGKAVYSSAAREAESAGKRAWLLPKIRGVYERKEVHRVAAQLHEDAADKSLNENDKKQHLSEAARHQREIDWLGG